MVRDALSPGPSDQLYDLLADPYETDDLLAHEKLTEMELARYEALDAELTDLLDSELADE